LTHTKPIVAFLITSIIAVPLKAGNSPPPRIPVFRLKRVQENILICFCLRLHLSHVLILKQSTTFIQTETEKKEIFRDNCTDLNPVERQSHIFFEIYDTSNNISQNGVIILIKMCFATF